MSKMPDQLVRELPTSCVRPNPCSCFLCRPDGLIAKALANPVLGQEHAKAPEEDVERDDE